MAVKMTDETDDIELPDVYGERPLYDHSGMITLPFRKETVEKMNFDPETGVRVVKMTGEDFLRVYAGEENDE